MGTEYRFKAYSARCIKMKQTNYFLPDFLDFDFGGTERLWRACSPSNIDSDHGDIVVEIPFQKYKPLNDFAPDTNAARKSYTLRLRSYGDKILRVSIGFGEKEMPDSEMLQLHPELRVKPLHFEKAEDCWTVKDGEGKKKAVFNFQQPPTDHWSDLLPPPQETLDIRFYPDGDREIKISAYDQFFPARQDALPLAYVEKKGENDRTVMSFYAKPDETFAGSGERFVKMDLSGKTFQLKNQDGQGVNSRRTYKNIPFYISSQLYGLFIHSSHYGKISFADHSIRSVQILVEQPLMDVFMIGGENVEEIIYGYRQLTGFPSEPPLWSYGVWMSRMTYYSAHEVTEICDRMRKEDFPCDVIHLDTGWFRTDWLCEWKFNEERFPDPPGFIDGLKKKGFRVSLWQMPYVAAEAEQLEEAASNRYIAPLREKKKQGGSNFSALDYAGTIDFTYSKAVAWYKGLLKNLLDMGAACIKTDFGEDIHMEAEYRSMKPEALNNLYALLYQKAAFEITKEVTGEGVIWARAGWAGSQRYPLHWSGDAACTWDGMAGSLKGGLHLGLSGFGFWSHDVPGFHGVPDFMNTVVPDDLYVRWTQFGVFSSHIRYHGTSKREPYHYPEIAGIVRSWLKLRYSLIPYIAAQGKKACETGYPVLRALIFHHPHDRMCRHIDDQYYFGDDFLVAPVMNSENIRDVYLPEGEWVDFFTGKREQGGKWLKNVHVPLEEMPVWARYGANVPVYPEAVSCTDEMELKKVETLRFDDSYEGIYNTVVGQIIKK